MAASPSPRNESITPESAPGETPWHLSGNYAPVPDELTAFDLPVAGAIFRPAPTASTAPTCSTRRSPPPTPT
jgi:hypothetical protein